MYLKQTKLLYCHDIAVSIGSISCLTLQASFMSKALPCSLHSKGKNIPFSSELPTDLQPRHIKVKDSYFSNVFELFSTPLSFKGTSLLMTVKSIYDKTYHIYFKFNYLIVSYFSSMIVYEIIAEKSYTNCRSYLRITVSFCLFRQPSLASKSRRKNLL